MPSTNRLGIKVALITLLVFIALYGGYRGVKKLVLSDSKNASNEEAPLPSNTLEPQDNFSIDSDNDELPDLVENVYHTDPSRPDTDSDGTLDGKEVSLGRDPLTPAPNDLIKDILTGDKVSQQDTYTAKYLATLPTDLPREDVLNKDKIAAFVEQEKGSILPEVSSASIKTTSETGGEAIESYLNSISSVHNPGIKAVSSTDIDTAFKAYYSSPTTSTALKELRIALEQNIVALQKITPPQEALALHTKLLAASQALVDNVKLLERMPEDFIGGLIGAKKIEELGSVFQSISEEVIKLEEKYKL